MRPPFRMVTRWSAEELAEGRDGDMSEEEARDIMRRLAHRLMDYGEVVLESNTREHRAVITLMIGGST